MKNPILQIFNVILTEPLLNQITRANQEKLSTLTKKTKERNLLLKLIQQSLDQEQQVVIRLKVLCILQNLLSHHLQEKNIELINSIITAHEKRTLKDIQKCFDISDMNNYLQTNVQLPYTIFLRKIIYWQNHEEYDQIVDISLGFSLINKLKQIIQLKKIFHNYGCYFPNHKYAINIFKQTLFFVKKLWNDICFMVKDITALAIRTNSILQEEFLLICAAQEVQQALIQFLYGGYFSKNIGKDKKITFVQLLKPQIIKLQVERKKKIEEENMIECLKSKRQSRKLCQKNHSKKTGDSQNLEQKLTTQMEVQILDSILRLQSLLSQ